MDDDRRSKKRVLVHIGPHRTGSTAIQHCLSANSIALEAAGISFMHSELTHDAALLLKNGDYDEATAILKSISRQMSISFSDVYILSQEDFSGDLPGRTYKKSIYPRMMKNLRVIRRGLLPHEVRFVFFARDPREWLISCYHQHLKLRTQFHRFEDFANALDPIASWREKLERIQMEFGEAFIVRPYKREPSTGTNTILDLAGYSDFALQEPPKIENISPSPDKVAFLERANELSSFKETAWFAKSLILREWTPKFKSSQKNLTANRSDELAKLSFPELLDRANSRIRSQDVEDILPDEDIDLDDLAFRILPKGVDLPAVSRESMRGQLEILNYHLRGKSELARLNGLAISYLRRDTAYTAKARKLFHRIWSAYGVLLVNELSTRWLISTLQTFLDHGVNEGQRVIGASGYFLANMMKIYEGERAIEGLHQDGLLSNTSQQTPNRFSGLDRFEVGGTDLLVNTTALALDVSMRDEVAGLVLQEFMLRMRYSGNVFTRMDKTRKALGINVAGFEDTWSFFVEPK